ncbi:MAG TPA: ABC transporter permease [Solirubrobacterales bacterium]
MSDIGSSPPPAPPSLRAVEGPSALGGGRRRFFDLLWLMALTEFKRVYFGTVLGYLWSLLRPLMFFGVLLFVFTQVFKVGSNHVEHYAVLLLMGIVMFTFFQEASTNSVTSVAAQEGVVRKTQFPRLVIPISTVLTALFNFGLNLVIVLVFLLAFGVSPDWTWLLFPVLVLALFIFTAAVSTSLAMLYVRFRDVAIIWTVAAQMLFYATPILYPIDFKENATFEHILMINPLSVIVVQARVWVLDEPGAPTAVDAAGGWLGLLPALAVLLVIVGFATWYFNREAPRVAEDL